MKKKKSTSKFLLILIGGALLIAAGLLFITFFTGPDVSVETQGVVTQGSLIRTDFKTEIFEDQRMKGLRQYGPAEIQVTQRGTKTDPFQAF